MSIPKELSHGLGILPLCKSIKMNFSPNSSTVYFLIQQFCMKINGRPKLRQCYFNTIYKSQCTGGREDKCCNAKSLGLFPFTHWICVMFSTESFKLHSMLSDTISVPISWRQIKIKLDVRSGAQIIILLPTAKWMKLLLWNRLFESKASKWRYATKRCHYCKLL